MFIGDQKLQKLVCSNKPKPRVQRGARGHAGWGRDVFHVQRSGMTTLCGIDCSEWLRLDPKEKGDVIADPDCCARCAAHLI